MQTKSVLLEPPARRSKFYFYFGKIIFDFPKGKNSFLPSQCPTKQMQYGRSGSVGGSIPPWSSVARYAVVFEHVSSECPP